MNKHQRNQTVRPPKSIKFQWKWDCKILTSDTYDSCPFSIPEYGKEQWKIRIHTPSGFHSSCSLYLYLHEQPKEYIINLTFRIHNPSSLEHFCSQTCSGPLRRENGFKSFAKYDTIQQMQSPIHRTVLIVCELKLKSPLTVPLFDIPKCNLAHDLRTLCNDATTADVALTVTNKQFYAHRAILTARSSYFAAMFRNNMQETITNNIDITDLSADILQRVLLFIYTDEIPDSKNNVIELLYAADKYDLKKLKAICEKTLYENINVQNAVEILVIADRHRAFQLKTQAVRFIKSHMEEIISTNGYENLKKYYPGLIIELFEAVAKKKRSFSEVT